MTNPDEARDQIQQTAKDLIQLVAQYDSGCIEAIDLTTQASDLGFTLSVNMTDRQTREVTNEHD